MRSAEPGLRLAAALGLLLAGCGGSGSSGPPVVVTPSPAWSASPTPVGTMVRGPYLQHAASGVSVVWYTETATEGRLRWLGQDGSHGEASSSAGLATRHEAVVAPIAPEVRYTYRVSSERGLLAAADGAFEFSFKAPETGVLRAVLFGDCGDGGEGQAAVARAIAAEPVRPDLLMIAGDVVYPPSTDAVYDARFFAPYRALLPFVPFYATPGNHDYDTAGGKPFFDVFTLPTNGPAGLPESSYLLERAGAQLIVHDTNQSEALLRERSLPWHASVTQKPASFRLVVQHHVLYSSGPHYGQAPAGMLRELLAPVYTASGVDIVFCGHDHLYERTRPIGGVVYVTTGAGGAQLYARTYTNAFTEVFVNDRHSYTWLEIRGRNLQLRQMDTEGRTIDTLAITKPVLAADALLALSAPGEASFRATRRFVVAEPARVTDAVLRVAADDYLVRLDGVEVARGTGPAAFAVPPGLLRPGENELAIESRGAAPGAPAPALELALSSPGRR